MGLKKNILYSSFLTTSLYIFQFITYPYVARVLGVTNIGICNLAQSLVQYFSLFSMLGITTLGVREIAKCNGDKIKISKTFSELFTLNAIFTFVVLVLYVGAIELIPQFHPYKKLLYIGASQLVFGTLAVEWLFRGLENFKYITIRTLFVRTAYVVSIFLFVHDTDDYATYFTIHSGMIIANGIINWNYGLRFVHFSFQPLNKIKLHIKPLLFLGSQLILTSLYTTFNTVYLGMMCGDTQVGYYTTATKIQNIILALYSSFTLVMMPRISALMVLNNADGVKRMTQQSLNLLFAFVFPCIIFSEFYAEEFIYLIAGSGYEGAVFPMRLVMPLMLVIGLEQILIIQILMPARADKQVFINSVIGASCSIILNLCLVSRLQSVGSSIVWFISELAVMAAALFFVRQKYKNMNFVIDIIKHLGAFLPLLFGYYLLSLSSHLIWTKFFEGFALTLLYSHFALFYIAKNSSYVMFTKSIIYRFIHK
ncbi:MULTISPECIES: flippase [Bacteroides]|jgi:O-antigen/teichoic acid export membrane protein|uniref:flippase n=1 Tax=Bacteroides TaxID=816 RepID=UPI000E470E11|nr:MULTISPECIES: flippase [Bacteroides]RHL09641.1 flippase [Bacteroides sp. AF39-11AC]